MKIFAMVLSTFLYWPLSAVPQSESLIATSTNQLSDGRVALSLSNNAQVPLLAFQITETQFFPSGHVAATSSRIFDSVTNPRTAKPVLPGQATSFPLGGIRGGKPPVAVLDAAVFADGTTFGDQAGIQRIIERRKFTLKLVEEALSALQEAADKNLSREQLVERFKTFKEDHAKANPDPDHVLLVDGTSDTILANLTRGQRSGDPNTIPVSQAVSHLIEQLCGTQENLINSMPKLKNE